jgi:hypothetical protein
MRAIREAMLLCNGAVIVGLARRFAPVTVDRFNSPKKVVQNRVFTSTPWNHLEAGMAYQLDLPLLILKEKAILPEGILDQALSEYLVFEFDPKTQASGLSKELKETIAAWTREVIEYVGSRSSRSQR